MQSKSPKYMENECILNKLENTSIFMTQNDSIDSIDQLNGGADDEEDEDESFDLKESIFNLNNILLKENVVYFKILNLYAISSEKSKHRKYRRAVIYVKDARGARARGYHSTRAFTHS